MSFGFGFGFPKNYVAATLAPFTPAALFTGSTTGVWHDPSDMTTLFQDAAGTLPVTAVEQPVGLMLDKSKGLVLGPEIFTDVCVIQNGGTSGAYSAGAISNSLAGTSGYPRYRWAQPNLQIGKTYKITIAQTNASVFGNILFDNAVIAGAASLLVSSGTVTCYVKYNGVDNRIVLYANGTVFSGSVSISIRELPGNHALNSSGNSANFPVRSARYNLYVNTETLATQNVTTVATRYKLTFTGGGSITLTGTATGVYTAGSYTISCTAGTLTSTVLGTVTQADLRIENDALNQPAYQRVNTSSNYDTVGFKPYLTFNGTNQWLQTNSIDFTYGDKMFVSAGVRKLGDAIPATLAELSTNSSLNAGTFLFKAPQVTITGAYGFWSSGSLLGNALATGGSAAPITNVVSGIGNISGDQAMLRINGSQASSSSGDQGSGNYGNYALYIGASAGTSLFFNGRLYGLVVAGKQASASEIASTEAWLNQKTGAY